MKSPFFLKIAALVFCIVLLGSCNSPLSRAYRAADYEEDIQEIRKSNKINEEEVQLLSKYIVLSRLSGNDLTGRSYKEMLKNIKSFQQKNDDAGAKELLEKESRRQRLSSFLEVTLLKKEFSNIKNKEVLTYTISFRNISSQNIKTITGNLLVNDLLEKPVKQISILLDEDIKPGQTLTKIDTLPYNNADVNDQRMRSKDLIDMRVVWNPEKIILENGKLLE